MAPTEQEVWRKRLEFLEYGGQRSLNRPDDEAVAPAFDLHMATESVEVEFLRDAICSITSSGFEIPPDQKASQTRSIWLLISPVSMGSFQLATSLDAASWIPIDSLPSPIF